MAATFIYKPETYKGPVVLVPDDGPRTPPTITGADGKSYTGRYLNTNEGRHQFVFPPEVIGLQGASLSYEGQSFTIGDGRQSYEGSNLSNLQPRAKGSIGSGGGGSYPSGFAPGTSPGGYGSFPAYQNFPSPTMMAAAQLMFTDPAEFAKKYSPLITKQFVQNYDVANNLALKQLNTELTGMEAFVPAASALKRRETSVDNVFNQFQRTQQINQVAPGLGGAIQDQLGRAQTYASGRAPDEVTDRGLELGVRSSAADQSAAGGFGASSSVAKKASDLMSADQRIKLSQYGDQLLGQNVQNQNFLMAPTEYSNAGQQVNVMPSVSGSQLGQNNLNQLNQYSMLPISSALNATIQQNTTQAGFDQQANQYNAGVTNDFALKEFDYNVGYASSTAAANQTDINTNFQIDQQKQYQDTMNKYMQQSQNAGLLQTITQGIGALFGGSGQGDGIIQQLTSLFGGGDSSGGGTYGPGATYDTGLGITPAEPIGVDTPVENNVLPNEDVLDYNDFAGSSGSGLSLYSNDTTLRKVGGASVSTTNTNLRSAPAEDTSAPLINDNSAPASTSTKSAAPEAIVNTKNILRSAGISSTPTPGSVNIGYNERGQPVYSNAKLNQSNDPSFGYKLGQGYSQILNDMGAFKTEEEKSNFDQAISIGQDVTLAAGLGDAAARGDKKAFINLVLGAIKKPLINKLTDNPEDAAGLSAAFSATKLFSSWDKLSATQKGLALTNIGIKTYQYGTGTDLTKQPLVYNSDGSAGMTVGQGLGLIQAGYNTFALVKNWDDMTTLQKIAGGTGTAAEVASLAKSFGMMGAGTSGAAVATTQASLANASFNTVVPQFGPGAVFSPLGNAAAPEGYTLISQGAEGTIAVPTANAGSAAGATGAEAGTAGASEAGASTLGTVAGVASIAVGAKAVYDGWGTGGSAGAKNGAIGGSAIAGGMYALGYTNPYLMAGIMVVSIASNATKVGKSTAQMERDAARGVFKGKLADDNYDVKLADGTLANIGVDGHGDYHMAKDPSKIIGGKGGGRLQAFDIDYTNDLDYTAGLGGISLARLLTGTKATNIDQIGGQVGNAAIKNIGYGKDMTQSNFNTMMANMRGFYSQSGIKAKSDAYQLANQAFAENRISAADLASMQRTFDMMYDKGGYQLAQSLMAGRTKGIEEVQKGATTGVNVNGVIREGKDNPIAENVNAHPKYVTGNKSTIRPGSTFIDREGRGGAVSPSATSQAPAQPVRGFDPGSAVGNREAIIAANRNKYGQKNAFQVGSAL